MRGITGFDRKGFMTMANQALEAWVNEVANITKADSIHWCDGSDEENQSVV